MRDILIVTGTCGVGKSTIARRWAGRRLGAIIDCDVFRSWIRNPALIRAEGFQEMLLARHAALLAGSYMAMGLDVAIDNVWTPAGLAYLQEQLQDRARIRVVWLRAASAENHRRDEERPLSDVQGARVDELQGELDALDWPDSVIRFDTTGQSVEETLCAIERAFEHGPVAPLSGLSLRMSTTADADFICDVMRATMTDYVMQAWAPSVDAAEVAYREDMIIGQDQIIVLSGKEIGVISIERKPDEIYLDKLFILPDYQGWGIGTHLIRGLLEEGLSQGVPVRLGVLKVNPARRLYERLGFVVEGEEGVAYLMVAAPTGMEFGSSDAGSSEAGG